MSKFNKKNLEIASKYIEDLATELRDVILLKTFDKLAMKCYENKEYSTICLQDKETICKQILVEGDFTNDINNWTGKYSYLVKHLLNLIKTISLHDQVKVKIENKSKITNFVNGPRLFELSKEQYEQFPEDFINFILKNRKGVEDDQNIYLPGNKLYIAIENGKMNEIDKILKKYYIPQNVKDELVKMIIKKYNNEAKTNIIADFNNINISMVEIFAQYGANKFVIIDEFKKYGNTEFQKMYSAGM